MSELRAAILRETMFMWGELDDGKGQRWLQHDGAGSAWTPEPEVLELLELLAAPQPEPSAGLRTAATRLANEAARAVTEPRRFHENEEHRQQALSGAVAELRAALAAAPSPALDVERLARAMSPGPGPVTGPTILAAHRLIAEYARLTAEDAP